MSLTIKTLHRTDEAELIAAASYQVEQQTNGQS